jgi:hypothetical protein
MRIVAHPATKHQFAIGGRRRPSPHSPRLRLANYLGANLPDPPAAGDYCIKARAALKEIYLNDALGDCVVAGAAHMIGVWTGNALPRPAIFGEWAIKNAYRAFSDAQYPASDSGCDEIFALNLWAHEGFAPTYANPHKIVAWVAVDAANPRELRAALWLFEGLMSGVELPDAWINPPPSGDGFTFDVAGDPVPTNGHCMTHFSWDVDAIGCATWGMYGRITDAALAKYMTPANGGALYAAVSQDALIRGAAKAPNGFDAAQLLADARRIGFAHA